MTGISPGLRLDGDTLFVVSLLVTVTASILFLLNAARAGGAAGRWWGVVFLCAASTDILYLMAGADEALGFAYPVGNGMFATAIAFIWLGARCFHGRRPLVAAALAGPWSMVAATLVFDRPLGA